MTKNITLKKDQVYKRLKGQIESGALQGGEKLPREQELSIQLNVSTITLRAALQRLAEERLIERIHGRGTFVCANPLTSSKPEKIMIIHDVDNSIAAMWRHIVPSLTSIAYSANYEVIITTNEALEMFSNQDIRQSVIDDNIIGIIAILSSFKGNEKIIDKIKVAEVPVVIPGGNYSDSAVTGFASIIINEKNAWEAAIIHLSEQGFTRIGVLGLRTSLSPLRHSSEADTRRLVEENGMYTDNMMIKEIAFNFSDIQKAIQELMALSQPPDAILCYSDFMAVHAYRALKILGLKIPDDIAVMGICGYPDAQRLTPSLTTIDFEYAEIARMAFEMILEPDRWYDPVSKKGKLRAKQFKLQARQSTKQQQTKEVSQYRNYSQLSFNNVQVV